MDSLKKVCGIMEQLRRRSPLIHHITNMVSMNDCANVTLAAGASPVMAMAETEAAEMAAASDALVLNIGTLNEEVIRSMLAAGKAANQKGIPVVFDPVGAGATGFRRNASGKILNDVHCSVIRGNTSEIKALAGLHSQAKGVDSGDDDIEGAEDAGKQLALEYHCVVAITGKTDIITDGDVLIKVKNGTEMLKRVTGTGCMTTSLIASFTAATEDILLAAAGAVTLMGLAGEKAQNLLKEGEGLGSFHIKLIDAISTITGIDLMTGGKWDAAVEGKY